MTNNKNFNLLDKFIYTIYIQLATFLSFLGYNFIYHFGTVLGFLMYIFLFRRRKLAFTNIKERLNYTEKEAKKMTLRAFQHNARSFLEIVLIKSFSFYPEKTKVIIAEPNLFKELQNHKGPIVATTAHMGAWELMAALVGDLYKEPRQRFIVVKQYPQKATQAFITHCRESHKAIVVGNKKVASTILRALKNNAIVAFLVDHSANLHEALYIDFLGKKASVNMGPALLALRGNALILPIFLVRVHNADYNGYVMHIKKTLDTTKLEGTREEKVKRITEYYTKAVEEIIRQYPEQWFWLHNRWK